MDGKCTEGDRWSSEEGAVERHGNTFWENDEIYGNAEAATSDDYKNKGYFEIDAEQMMIIQVPNDEPTEKFVSSASFQYTTDAFLEEYGGNLQGLFQAYPIIDRDFKAEEDDGPAVEINFVKGTAREAFKQYGYDMQDEMVSGYMQFRVINKEHGATSFCPYGKMKGGWASSSSAEHGCFAATIADVQACGDFSAFDGLFNDIGFLNNWATSKQMRKSAFLILYR
jgi:intelectin